METRICNKCDRVELSSRFRIKGKYIDKTCKTCRNKEKYERMKLNKEKMERIKIRDRARQTKYRETHPEVMASRKSRVKGWYIKKKYGLSVEEYESMYEQQDGKCYICLKALSLNIDHCHTTGKVRGLLCFGCNIGLGGFKDNIESLTRAIKYLNKFG